MAEERQWHGKTGGGDFGQKALFFLLKNIPVTLFYPILTLIIPFYLLFSRKGTKAIWNYYRNILKYSYLKSIGACYVNELTFGKVVLDKFAVLAGNNKQFDIRFTESDIQNFSQLLDGKKGIILAGSHIGNFELLGQCFNQDKKKISCIIFGGESQGYQERRNSSFAKQNVQLIPIQQDMSHLFAIKNALDNGDIIAILSDRHFGGRKIKKCRFMGHEAYFPTGIFTMAAQMDIPVVSTFIMKEKRNRYSGYLKQLKIDENIPSISGKTEALLNQYAASIEEILRQYPNQWFNYFPFWEDNK